MRYIKALRLRRTMEKVRVEISKPRPNHRPIRLVTASQWSESQFNNAMFAMNPESMIARQKAQNRAPAIFSKKEMQISPFLVCNFLQKELAKNRPAGPQLRRDPRTVEDPDQGEGSRYCGH